MAYTSNLGNQATYLENVGVAFLKDTPNAVVNQIPAIKGNRTDTYFQFDENMVAYRDERNLAKIGSTKDKPNEVEFNYTEKSITIKPYHEATSICEFDIAEAMDLQINQLEDKVKALITRGYNYLNLDLCELIVNTSIFSNADAGSLWFSGGTAKKWTADEGDPERDFNAIDRIITAKSGGVYSANTAIMGKRAFEACFLNKNIETRTSSVLVKIAEQIEWLKEKTGLQRIVVLPAYSNTAKEGKTATMVEKLSTSVFVGYIPLDGVISKQTPSAIARATLKGVNSNEFGLQVSINDKRNGATFDDMTSGVKVGVQLNTNIVSIAPALGYVLTNVY